MWKIKNDYISLIEALLVKSEEVPDDAIHLFRSNEEPNIFNTLQLNRIQTDAILLGNKDSVKGLRTGENKNTLERDKLFKTSRKLPRNAGLSYELKLKTITNKWLQWM